MNKFLPTKSGARKTTVRTPVGSSRCFRILLFLIAFGSFSWLQPVQAQTTAQIGTGTVVPASTLFGPIYRFSNTSTTNGARANMLWTAAEMTTAGIPSGAIITKVEFNKTNAASFTGTVPFQMLLGNTSNTTLATTHTWAAILTTHTPVINSPAFNIPEPAGWIPFVFSNPFVYTGGSLEIATEYALASLTSPHSTDAFKWEYTTGTADKIVAAVTATGATLNSTTSTYKHRPNIRITYVVPVPCSGAPTPGTVTALAPSVCSGGSVSLSLTGYSLDTGIGIQWQSSPDGVTFTDIPGAVSPNLTTTQTATTHYKVVATCNGASPASSNVVIIQTPNNTTGTFTINSAVNTGGTNFRNFADAVNYISCGIAGPVVFNVVTGSGPYQEQVVLTAVPGASATNTITFNGNGNTVSASPVSATRAVFKLDGADFITLNNFNIETDAASTYGWGIHFLNGADNNTISNNTITIGSTSTTESNSTGIVFSSSETSTTTTGGNNGNNNVISGNTIIGGYKGIQLHGLPANPGNNQILNNTIKDYHTAGVEVNGVNGTLIEGNTFSRPTRPAVGTFYGVYLGGTNRSTVINKNIIHNTHGGATSLTGTAYGIYSTSNDAPVGSENIVKNNLIYGFNGTGSIYGFYNSGSDGIYYYNNTVSLENMGTTGIVRGFHQVTSATNLKLINNNIVVISGGVATNQQAIYLSTAASTIESNRNNLYVPNGNTGYHNATQYATLANWQTANSGIYDQNSVAADPFFTNVSAANFVPTNSVLNNAGQPLAAVTHDITGAPRHATTPDIGAYEFTPSSLDLGVTAQTTPGVQNCYSNAEPVTVTVTNFGTSAIDFTAITANVTVTITGAATPTPISIALTNAMNGGAPLAPAASMSVLVGTADMTTAGTYTFNAVSAVTAGGTDGNAANNAMPATNVVVTPLAAGTAAATNTELCLSGTSTLNLTGNSGGNIQWQSGASATGPFTDIAGATSATYTLAAPITQTTYYQAVVSCGPNSLTSTVVAVNVANPVAPTVPAAALCGPGAVTLAATAAPGAIVTWYDVATGGAALDTGATFTTNVTGTTTFYASTKEGGFSENVGIVNGGINTYINSSVGWGLHFRANDPVTINSVNVYAVGTGTITIKITDPNDLVLYTAQPVNITAAVATQKLLIPVNLSIPAGTYKMVMSHTGITNMIRESSGVSYPYTSPSGAVTITAGANGTGSASATTAYYWFYDWSVSTGCESARTPVTVTVNPKPATPTITQGGVGNRDLTSSAATGNQWLLNGTAIAGATAQTYTATANGNYAVVVTNANGCSSDTSAIVNITNTGVRGELAGMSVSVYPNPNKGQFNVKLMGYKQDAALELYSLTGQLIVKETAKAGNQTTPMQVKNLAAGTYLLKVVSEKGVQISKLIVE